MALIAVCSGPDRPRSVADVVKRRLGDTHWENQFNLTIPIRTSGVAQWLVYVDGLDVRGVRMNPPAVVSSDSVLQFDIHRKPGLIMNG